MYGTEFSPSSTETVIHSSRWDGWLWLLAAQKVATDIRVQYGWLSGTRDPWDGCYNWLSLRDFFSSHPYHSTYVSTRPMSVSRGPVCILIGSSLFFLRALPLGRPYPCSPSALRFLSGVGSHLWSRCYVHSLFVIPADRSISSRRFSRIVSCSSWLTLVLLYSIEFHDDAYSSTYTDCRCISSLRLFYAIQGILSRPSLTLNLQSLSVSTSDFKSLSLA